MAGSPPGDYLIAPMGNHEREVHIKTLRDQVLSDSVEMMPIFAERVTAEGTPAAYKMYYDVAMKMVPGLSADSRNKDDHLPLVTINFGVNGGLVTTIEAAPPPAAGVEDVVSRPVKVTPEDEAAIQASIDRVLQAKRDKDILLDPFEALVAAMREDDE